MKQQTEDEDLVAVSDEITLKDPIVLCRINTPIKSSKCRHIQCFDGLVYLSSNRSTPSWECPICNRRITFESLSIDGYFKNILEKCSESVESVQILPNGEWTPSGDVVKAELSSKSTTHEVFELISDDDDERTPVPAVVKKIHVKLQPPEDLPPPQIVTEVPTRRSMPSNNTAIIIISDSEDEFETHRTSLPNVNRTRETHANNDGGGPHRISLPNMNEFVDPHTFEDDEGESSPTPRQIPRPRATDADDLLRWIG